MGTFALTATGTPAKGRGSPRAIPAASASARSPSTSTNALSRSSTDSIRRSVASTASAADTPPARMSAASSGAVLKATLFKPRLRLSSAG